MMNNTKVELKYFLGTLQPPNKTKKRENYRKLIGQKGIVIEEADFNPEKVLVLFEKELNRFNVENHNPVKNTLYINKTDLLELN